MGTIFVAGVHGVGKTTCCIEVAQQLCVPHYSASELIKAEKQAAIAGNTKEVIDVRGNQELLTQAVQRRLYAGQSRLLLDGHFTLLNSEKKIQMVELSVFVSLSIDGIVVFRDDPESIQTRLQERDKHDWDVDLIATQQNAELQHAATVATALRVPINYFDAFSSRMLLEMAGSIWTMTM